MGNATDTSVTLNWTETTIADFQKYEVHKGTTANFTPDPETTLVGQVVELATTTFGLSPLMPDKDYWFKILVYDTAGQATASNEVHVKTLTTLALFNTPPAGTSFLVETRKYDAAGQLVARYDGKGNGTFYAYNAAGQQTKVTDALGHETTLTYDAAGNKLNALNGQTIFAYDNAGRMTSTTDALANVTQFGYDANGNQTTVTDARGNVTTRAYNSRNRLTTLTDALGHVTSFTFDAVGNRLNELNALNQQTTFTYDAAGRLISQTDPAGHVATFEYDPVGNRTKVTDANGNQTQSAYNPRNLRITETNALGDVTTFGFDAVGNRTTVTDGKGATWTYTFDWANRETSMTQPDNTVEKKAYDPVGNLLAKLKPDGNVIKYDYDKLNRLVKKDYPTGTDTTFAYDALGRRTQMVDSTGTTSYTYDALGRLLSCSQPCGAVSKTVSHTYDNVGNRATMTDPDGGVTSYQYDGANRLTSLTNPFNETTGFVHDAVGRLTRQNNTNGTYSTWTFDAAGQVSQVASRKSDDRVILKMDYARDNVGNPTSVSEQLVDTDNQTLHEATITYGYDNINRLTLEKRVGDQPIWYEYTMDAAGNRTQFVQKDGEGNIIGTTNASYDAANKMLTYGNTTYTWDGNGNMASKTTNNVTVTYGWDYENKLAALTDGSTLSFTYNGDGLRHSKTVDGTTTHFVYSGVRLLKELDGNGATQGTYTLAPIGSEWEPLISHRKSGASCFYAFDALGTTRALTFADEIVSATFTDDAWGNTLTASDAAATPHQYVGRYGYYIEVVSGLQLLTQRYYDSGLGRFVSQDPARAWANWLLYQPLGGPTSAIDPSGLDVKLCSVPGGGSFGAHAYICVQNTDGSWNCFGYYPKGGKSGSGKGGGSSGSQSSTCGRCSLLLGGDAPGEIRVDIPGPKDQCCVVTTTPAQDKAIRDRIKKDALDPPCYKFWTHNCADWAADALTDTGIVSIDTSGWGTTPTDVVKQCQDKTEP